MRRLEVDNDKLRSNNNFVTDMLYQLLSFYTGRRKYTINEMMEALGQYLEHYHDKPDRTEHKIDLLAQIIKKGRMLNRK